MHSEETGTPQEARRIRTHPGHFHARGVFVHSAADRKDGAALNLRVKWEFENGSYNRFSDPRLRVHVGTGKRAVSTEAEIDMSMTLDPGDSMTLKDAWHMAGDPALARKIVMDRLGKNEGYAAMMKHVIDTHCADGQP